MKSKQSKAPDSCMQSMNEQRECCDDMYTLPTDFAINMNRPYTKQETAPMNVDATFNAGLVLRQKL